MNIALPQEIKRLWSKLSPKEKAHIHAYVLANHKLNRGYNWSFVDVVNLQSHRTFYFAACSPTIFREGLPLDQFAECIQLILPKRSPRPLRTLDDPTPNIPKPLTKHLKSLIESTIKPSTLNPLPITKGRPTIPIVKGRPRSH